MRPCITDRQDMGQTCSSITTDFVPSKRKSELGVNIEDLSGLGAKNSDTQPQKMGKWTIEVSIGCSSDKRGLFRRCSKATSPRHRCPELLVCIDFRSIWFDRVQIWFVPCCISPLVWVNSYLEAIKKRTSVRCTWAFVALFSCLAKHTMRCCGQRQPENSTVSLMLWGFYFKMSYLVMDQDHEFARTK